MGMSIETRKLAGNIGVAFVAQGFALCVSFIMSFFVPKILGTQEFGYWQLFIFYTNYVSLLQFGLNDGIYLIYGGRTRDELDLPTIRAVFRTNLLFQLLVATVIMVCAVCFIYDQSRMQVLIATGLYAFLFNITYFIGFLFQATNEVKKYSVSQVIDRLFFLIVLLFLIVVRVDSFIPYVVAFLFGRCVAFGYAIVAGWDFIWGQTAREGVMKECFRDMRVGIKLTFANMASLLVLGIFRFVVDAQWSIEVFGQFSLALTLVSFFLTFISQISMVLFPALRRVQKEDLAHFFQSVSGLLATIMPIAYIVYTPIAIVLSYWLPDYGDALGFFALLLPICVFDSRMSILGTTILKVARKETFLLILNCITVIFSFILALLGAVVLHDLSAMCLFAVMSVAARSLVAEVFLSRYLGLSIASHFPMLIGELALACIFIAVNSVCSELLAGALVLIAFLSFLLIFRCFIADSIKEAHGLFQ